MFKKTKAGFTLIELLVVISIIGMLASVVLVALNSARAKGRNSRIQQEVIQLRNQIELSYNGQIYTDLIGAISPNNVSFPGIAHELKLAQNTNLNALINDILAQNRLTVANGYAGGANTGGSCNPTGGGNRQYNQLQPGAVFALMIVTDNANCTPTVKGYAIWAAYGPNVGSDGYFCIDSAGRKSGQSTGGIPVTGSPTIVCI